MDIFALNVDNSKSILRINYIIPLRHICVVYVAIAQGCGPLAMMLYESKPPLGLGFRLGVVYRPVRHSHSNSA